MSDEEVLTELKNKGLPTFGTKQEKFERLKKHFGIEMPSKEASDQIPVKPLTPTQYKQCNSSAESALRP